MKVNHLVGQVMLGLRTIASKTRVCDKIVTTAMFTKMWNMSLKITYNFQSRNDAHIGHYLVAPCVSKLKYTPVL